MLCCSCKKNQATNIFEKEADGKKSVRYYCADCYNRLFVSSETHWEDGRLVCPKCKTTEEEFLSTGLVGCAECYRYLAPVVLPVLKRMQGMEKLEEKKTKERAPVTQKPFAEKNEKYAAELHDLDAALHVRKTGGEI